jgi:AcrR family transcriptional regulator
MSAPNTTPTPSRRDQAIAHAADLLREGGPNALTSVAVAERMGITQSAVYRHIRNMDELSAMAAGVLIEELNAVLGDALLDPSLDWEHIDDVDRLCRSLVDIMVTNWRVFAVVDQWRFVGGTLGVGIEQVVADVIDIVASILESRWRIEFHHQAALSATEATTVHRHAQAMHDDGHAVARLARSRPTDLDIDAIGDILKYRLLAGWASFVIDMNERVGLPFPDIDLDEGIVLD